MGWFKEFGIFEIVACSCCIVCAAVILAMLIEIGVRTAWDKYSRKNTHIRRLK